MNEFLKLSEVPAFDFGSFASDTNAITFDGVASSVTADAAASGSVPASSSGAVDSKSSAAVENIFAAATEDGGGFKLDLNFDSGAAGAFDFTTAATGATTAGSDSAAATHTTAASGAATNSAVSTATNAVAGSDAAAASAPAGVDQFDFSSVSGGESSFVPPPINVGGGGVGGLSDGVPALESSATSGVSILSTLPLIPAAGAEAVQPPAVVEPVVAVVEPVDLIQGRSVADILVLWSQDLHDHWIGLCAQAKQVRTWDHQLSENGKKLVALQMNVQRIRANQEKLSDVLRTIKENQDQLAQMLTELGTLDSDGALSENELAREEAYSLGEELSKLMADNLHSLHATIAVLNEAAYGISGGATGTRPGAPAIPAPTSPAPTGAAAAPAGSTAVARASPLQSPKPKPVSPLSQIVTVLNAQMQALQWLTESANTIERKFDTYRPALAAVFNPPPSRQLQHRQSQQQRSNSGAGAGAAKSTAAVGSGASAAASHGSALTPEPAAAASPPSAFDR